MGSIIKKKMSETNNAPQPPVVVKSGGGKPLPVTREQKLKVFAMNSVHKEAVDTFQALAKDKKICLGLSAAYSQLEAIEGARMGIEQMGLNPADFMIAFQAVSVDADKIIDMPSHMAEEVATLPKDDLAEKKAKSVQELIAYVRYVFNKVGSTDEISVAEGVIKKFEASQEK